MDYHGLSWISTSYHPIRDSLEMVLNIMEYRGLSMNIDEYCNINVHCKSGNSKEQCGLPMHIANTLNSLCKRLLFGPGHLFVRGCLKKQLSGKFVTIFVPWQVRVFLGCARFSGGLHCRNPGKRPKIYREH